MAVHNTVRMLMRSTAIAAAVAAVGSAALAQDAAIPSVRATLVTTASASGAVAAGVPWLAGSSNGYVGATALGGLEVYDGAGARVGTAPAGEVAGVDVAYGFDIGGRPATVVAAVDTTDNSLRLYRLDGSALTEVGARSVPLGFAAENVCLYRGIRDGALYAFVVGDGGEIDQQLIYVDADGRLDARQMRRLNVISTIKQCAVDGASGTVYASEESVGVWRFNANPEAFADPVLVDTPRFGKITEESGGLAVYDGGAGARWLIAADPNGSRLNVYNRDDNDAYVGSVAVTGAEGGEPVGELGPLFATSQPTPGFPNGMVVVTDEDGSHFKIISFADIAGALNLATGTPVDPRVRPAPPVPSVVSTVETAPVSSFGDAADDPAIWQNPTDPSLSAIVATDKKGGLYVYDMQGRVIQDLRDGKMNNIDLRDHFMLGGRPVTLVTASNRTEKSIAIYTLDPVTRRLTNVADGVQPTELEDPYGQCMYRDPQTGRTYVFINGDDTRKRQWELVDAGNGKVRAVFVRELTFASQTEGCVADDETGALYVNEEDIGMWRTRAAADGGTDMTLVRAVADQPATTDDYEGIGIYDLGGGRGYIVLSSQGNDTYAVFRREGAQEYLGSFAVAANPQAGIDGISETDGLEITSRNLGPGFEHGAMVAQDGRNVLPIENQNYKYVPWESIARALNLEMR